MEEEIKHAALCTRIGYAVFWLLPLLGVMAGEVFGETWTGMYAEDVRATYQAEAVTILLTAICVPVSLKLFAWILAKKIDKVPIAQAIRLYVRWSGIRLLLLEMPVLLGFLTYYLMLSTQGVLCAFIGLTASLFCIPGEKRMRRELHIHREE